MLPSAFSLLHKHGSITCLHNLTKPVWAQEKPSDITLPTCDAIFEEVPSESWEVEAESYENFADLPSINACKGSVPPGYYEAEAPYKEYCPSFWWMPGTLGSVVYVN